MAPWSVSKSSTSLDSAAMAPDAASNSPPRNHFRIRLGRLLRLLRIPAHEALSSRISLDVPIPGGRTIGDGV